MFKKGLHHVLMVHADAGQAAGSGAEGAGASQSAAATGKPEGDNAGAAAASASTGAGAGGKDQGSALQQAGQVHTPKIPEKYQVKKEDGSLDIEASSLKLAEAYGSLEKRIGTGDIPPKTPDEYQIAVPDALKDWNPKEDPILSDFLKKAHERGYTQKQIDLAMETYMDIAPKLVAGASQLSAEECTTQLKAEWKTDEQYKAEVGKAYQAAVGYGGSDADSIIKDYGNDPRIIRMLSRIGGEMGEDRSVTPPGGSLPGGQSIESLQTSEAYNNPKHPDHARVSKQVQEYYNKQAAAAEKAGGTPLF